MSEAKVYRAIGLMSGTALDGEIDIALIETDGRSFVKPLDFYAHPYDISVRDVVRGCFGKRSEDEQTRKAEELVTHLHVQAVKSSGFKADVIGFHGQTITHAPEDSFTWQLGDGAILSRETGISVVNDMRSADVKAGGEGAPLLPLYHKARVKVSDEVPSVAILNIGGVANITYIDLSGDLLAFDCGAGNALMDDFMRERTGEAFDRNGEIALKGRVRSDFVDKWLDHPFFYKMGVKSADRNEWSYVEHDVQSLSLEDGLATLMAFTVAAIKKADVDVLKNSPHFYVCGGGRHNKALMHALDSSLAGGAEHVEVLGWNGDATEAEGFAYLAVRSLLGLPLSLPSTTGVSKPITGGVHHIF
tara:strand:+ start:2476 stop:3555 length:1080 start_codon:yes stop_codon:yes gene_type:complete